MLQVKQAELLTLLTARLWDHLKPVTVKAYISL